MGTSCPSGRSSLSRDGDMIFVTVGAQLPFDRLIRAVDLWAGENRTIDVFAQTGKGKYQPEHIEYKNFLSPAEFESKMQAARCIVGHAGMGTIITAMEYEKPLLVMPRDATLGEHRNNHQMDTARRFAPRQHFEVAYNEEELGEKIDELIKTSNQDRTSSQCFQTSPELIKVIKDFISS
ncbi:MAG: glucuronosyltransferase [Candidatus Electrothrix sp. MAN1_4]|nr:glucuronosyltransferase [Candidatus Electrothrix sp. MAN1_4]